MSRFCTNCPVRGTAKSTPEAIAVGDLAFVIGAEGPQRTAVVLDSREGVSDAFEVPTDVSEPDVRKMVMDGIKNCTRPCDDRQLLPGSSYKRFTGCGAVDSLWPKQTGFSKLFSGLLKRLNVAQ